jgi:hypothetical protein
MTCKHLHYCYSSTQRWALKSFPFSPKIREFLGSFRYRKCTNFIRVPVHKSQIRNFFKLICKKSPDLPYTTTQHLPCFGLKPCHHITVTFLRFWLFLPKPSERLALDRFNPKDPSLCSKYITVLCLCVKIRLHVWLKEFFGGAERSSNSERSPKCPMFTIE